MKNIFLLLLLCSTAISEVVISPNMNLPVPVVGTTPGPDWANNINSCMGSIDGHDHTPGKGVPISSSSLNITTDFPLNNNSLTETKSVVFDTQTSFSTNQAIYVISPDLIYNDGNGNVVRITQNGSVSGAAGTITGLPSGTASASYQSVGGTFQFQSATNTPANGTFASISVAQQTTSPNTITIKSPNSLGASYNFTLPTSVPSYTSVLSMNTSGTLSTVPYKSPTVQQFTSGSGTYTTPTNPSPMYIKVKVIGGGGGGGGSSDANANASNGSDGSNSTFGTALLVASGGAKGSAIGGASTASGGAGGAASLGGAPGTALQGFGGGPGGSYGIAGSVVSSGGAGGGFGGGRGAAAGGGAGSAVNGAANTGGGGGGASSASTGYGGGGGGSGGFVEALIVSPSATYSYSVGAGGSGGAGGSAGGNGGAGGSGLITVEEYYQ